MRDAPSTPDPIGPEAIDCLVEGELSGAERRALLARLEASPDGWRRCALGFLEAQGWREALGPLAAPIDAETEPAELPRRRPGRPLALAMAACLAAVAFVAGWSAGVDRRPTEVVVAGPGPSAAVPGPPTPDEPDELRAVGLVQIPGGAAGSIRLPVLAGPGLDEGWLRRQPSFVPEDDLRRWRDGGYQVEHQRRLVSVQLDEEGRYLAIPVDEVFVRAPERSTY